MISPDDPTIKLAEIEKKIVTFIAESVENAGLEGAVVAVSGGIDSAVTLSLAVKALGPEKVTAITLPERDVTPERDITDVMQHTTALGLTCDQIDITPILHVIREELPQVTDRVAFGNVKSRLRMLIAYHYANTQRRMVIGTSNKTELLTGFFTKYGDGGVDLNPLADLYKTQLRQLAKHLEIPENIIEKTPSPGFWPGQTDEGELGTDYETIELILYAWEKGYRNIEIAEELGIPLGTVDNILNRVETNEHKRRMPLILRLS